MVTDVTSLVRHFTESLIIKQEKSSSLFHYKDLIIKRETSSFPFFFIYLLLSADFGQMY